jgi:hypothetical protein
LEFISHSSGEKEREATIEQAKKSDQPNHLESGTLNFKL